jgi:hypothetical protein
MKKLSIFLTVAATLAVTLGTLQAALPQPDLIAEAYFAGAQKISTAANVNAFTNEFGSAPALALRKQTADKLSVWLAGWLQSKTGVNVPDGAARLRPLLDDLQHSEWMFEARASAGAPEAALAIRLDAARMPAWTAGLKPFLPAASFTTSGDWLIFDSGTGPARLGATLAQKVALPQGGWFTLDVNWPRLAQWFPEAGRLALPETQFTVTAPDANFHINGKFIYPQPLALNLEAWKFPGSVIHEPLISFTAIRGFASWLSSQSWAQPYEVMPPPNQAFIWAGKTVPFATYAAAPFSDPANALAQIYALWAPRLTSQTASMFHFSIERTNNQVTVVGLPMVAPYVQTVNNPAGRFLLAGGFPILFSRKPIPPELFARLATPNLVLYHWEITADRVNTLLQPMQLGLLTTGYLQLDGNSAAYKWLSNMTPKFGNTDTEITQTAPDQLTFNRTAPGIFTAVELYALANWLEAKDFPGCDVKAPPLNKIKRIHPKAPAVKAPAATAPAPPK